MGMSFTVGIIPIIPFGLSNMLNCIAYMGVCRIPCIKQGLCYLIDNALVTVGMTFAVGIIVIGFILLTQ